MTLSAWVKPEHDANRVLDFGDDTTRYLCLAVRNVGGVVLGGRDSGVADPARPDGTTLLDAVGAGAPFRSKGALVARVGKVVDAWIAGGRLGRADGYTVWRTAHRPSCVP
ncbi:hypothetical protein GCM10009787_46730 [Streptomyces bangladeshensis]|uniref:Uncharacterized protein n=1 Tax=Streptomyces bangladeshensis TaxID=295352 RepID=A0ABN3BRC5_9ACTN